MKYAMKNLVWLFVFAFFMVFNASCTKDFKLIDGEWIVTSWVEDGEELLAPGEFSKIEMSFTEDGKDEGKFTFRMTYDPDDETEVYSGDYELDAKEDEITLTVDGLGYVFDYDVSKDQLIMSGNPDGTQVRIEAKPK